ncbi:hypothetical protein [Actinocrispum sp. NPDC049592]|uniref:hypothetical protein n=1 Tax=Actinocrispum sp. NPDC049592 TaxID=3154835 RepID=UPI0034415F7A
MKARSVLVVAASVACTALGVFAVPASAGLTTFCEGEAGAVTVPGDLRVAATKSCVLDGTIVTGTVTVEPGANLVITGGNFQREVMLQDDAFFDAKGTTFGSTVTAVDAYGFYLADTKSGNVKVSANQHPDRGTYAYLNTATVNGELNSSVGEVYAENSQLGSVTGTNVSYVDLISTVVNQNLTVSGARLGGVFCAGEVYGNTSYTGNQGALQIGADGPIASCGQASFFNGNVTASGNTGGVTVSNTIIRGNLAGVDNDPAPAGENNRVRGTISGQFVNLAPPAAARAAAAAAPQHNPDVMTGRKSDALAEAHAAGPAHL